MAPDPTTADAPPDAPPVELDRSFFSLNEYLDWRSQHAALVEQPYATRFVEHIQQHGLREPITDLMVRPGDVELGASLREGLTWRGVGSRHRAVMRIIEQTVPMSDALRLRVYAPEAVTAMALRLRSVFPKFLGTEFAGDPKRRIDLYPIQHEDLTALTLPSDTFDLVTTNEVLEHVPDIDASLREVARVLKDGCWHVGTHPFLMGQQASIVKARLEGGGVVHLAAPEYHGDPFGDNGSLVMEMPGWDILDRARGAGFSYAAMRLFLSRYHGCIAEDSGGVLVLCCRK